MPVRQYIHAVPNFSEGRRRDVIEAVVAPFRGVQGIRLIGYFPDPDFNRTVIEVVGQPEPLRRALVEMARMAVSLIDMESQTGSHPRIGAQDTIPLFPLRGISLGECMRVAEAIGEEVHRVAGVPVFFAGENARTSQRRALDFIRKGQYEGLRDLLLAPNPDPSRMPDLGTAQQFVGKGGVIVSAGTSPLVAVNFILNTRSLTIARQIAKAARGPSGGFSNVRAVGLRMEERDQVAVSMNMFDHVATPLHRTFNLVESEARRWGATICATQIVGTVPQEALIRAAEYSLRLERFRRNQIIENQVLELVSGEADTISPAIEDRDAPLGRQHTALGALPVRSLIDEVAADSPAPGGGSVAAIAGSLSAALAGMVLALTLGRPKFADVEAELYPLRRRCEELSQELLALADMDTAAFNSVLAARRLPRTSETERAERQLRIQQAYSEAATVPLRVAEACREVLRVAAVLKEKANPLAITDCGVAATMAWSGLVGASLNVRVNLSTLNDEAKALDIKGRLHEITEEARRLHEQAMTDVERHLQR